MNVNYHISSNSKLGHIFEDYRIKMQEKGCEMKDQLLVEAGITHTEQNNFN